MIASLQSSRSQKEAEEKGSRVPTGSSWLWFTELTLKRIRRGSFCTVQALAQAITDFLAAWNANPKPFGWTATVESIAVKRSRCRQTLEKSRPGSSPPRPRKGRR